MGALQSARLPWTLQDNFWGLRAPRRGSVLISVVAAVRVAKRNHAARRTASSSRSYSRPSAGGGWWRCGSQIFLTMSTCHPEQRLFPSGIITLETQTKFHRANAESLRGRNNGRPCVVRAGAGGAGRRRDEKLSEFVCNCVRLCAAAGGVGL